MLKKIVLGSALATMMAVPAFAQAYNPGWFGGNNVPTYYDAQGHLHVGMRGQGEEHTAVVAARDAYAYAPGAFAQPNRVYVNGQYVGQDPDANVRLQLQRNYETRY